MIVDNSPGHAIRNISGHEERDANIAAVMWFALSLIVTLIMVLFLVKATFHFFSRGPAEVALPFNPATGFGAEAPPEPRLQLNAPLDLKRLREQEDAVLNGYGWVDKSSGTVRIPIERAIDLLAQHGLPPLKPSGK